MKRTEITRDDLLDLTEYAQTRRARRQEMITLKKNRRLIVGPFASFHFECWDTMFAQVMEMLHIEKGGEEQIDGELEAYNPLIPKGNELTATVLLEIEDPIKRGRVLSGLGGIEETISVQIGNHTIMADPELDVDRTTPDGKTSAVHFLKFKFTDEQVAAFQSGEERVIVAIEHDNYTHLAVMPDKIRGVLAGDL